MKYFIELIVYSVIGCAIVVVCSSLVACNGNLTKDVHDLQAGQQAQNEQLQAQEAQLADLEAQLATLQAVLGTLNPQISGNESAIALLQAQIQVILERISRSPGQIRN